MGILCPEKSQTNRKSVIELLLLKGRDSAAQLENRLRNPSGDLSLEELVSEISRSFTESLSELESWDSGEVCQVPATTQVGSPSSGDLGSVDSGESTKRPPVKDRRGGYKRRKTTGDSWVTVSQSMEDGHAWRKYGQKEILNAEFPRCYFRCTHKNDQGCLAIKQVQRVQEDPHMYRSTYFGRHTCSGSLKASAQNIINISDPADPVESYLSFGSKIPTCTPSSAKEEEFSKEEGESDSIVWPDLMPLEHHSSGAAADYEDVISNVNCSSGSDHGFVDMDFLISKSDDFDSYFHFD